MPSRLDAWPPNAPVQRRADACALDFMPDRPLQLVVRRLAPPVSAKSKRTHIRSPGNRLACFTQRES
jgi:hypothetical protein